MKRTLFLPTVLRLCLFATAGFQTVTTAADIPYTDFLETFALAEDRADVLRELVPGTEAYYFFHCLHAQNTGDRETFETMRTQWRKRLGTTGHLRRLEARQTLLDFEANPDAEREDLRKLLNVDLNHQPTTLRPDTPPPSELDPALLDPKPWMKRARGGNTPKVTNEGLRLLAVEADLSPRHRRWLLQRLQLPTLPNLLDLIETDLREKDSDGFGTLPIHHTLTLDHLQRLLARRPELKSQPNFVTIYLGKLAPSADVVLERQPAERAAYYERLYAFARDLAPVHNPIKAAILYAWLDHDRAQGTTDLDRFFEYVTLPRNCDYVVSEFLRENRYRIDLGRDCDVHALPVIRNDRDLVFDYLQRDFATAADYAKYKPYIKEALLKDAFASAKITNPNPPDAAVAANAADTERWISMLPPARYQELKESVELAFTPDNPEHVAVDAPVQLKLAVKNVPEMLVKIYRLNTFHILAETGDSIPLDLSLDGLVPTAEQRHEFDAPPEHRQVRVFDFPECEGRGTWIIECIGNGISSRALVTRGHLEAHQHVTVAGHAFTLLDESLAPLPDATLWLGGTEYTADTNGVILVPFTSDSSGGPPPGTTHRVASGDTLSSIARRYGVSVSQLRTWNNLGSNTIYAGATLKVAGPGGATGPGSTKAILREAPDSDFASLFPFEHRAEAYDLEVGIHVARESLLADTDAVFLIRPRLSLHGHPVTIDLLDDPQLEISVTGPNGLTASTAQRLDGKFALKNDAETAIPFRVPPEASVIVGTLRASVRSLVTGKEIALSTRFQRTFNGATASLNVQHIHYVETPTGLECHVLGLNGEPVANHALNCSVHHWAFTEDRDVQLQTDATGVARLGKLPGIWKVQINGTPYTRPEARVDRRGTVHALENEGLQIPFTPSPRRAAPALFSVNGSGSIVADLSNRLAFKDGVLQLPGLRAGNYQGNGAFQTLRVSRQTNRYLSPSESSPLQISSIDTAAGSLRVRLLNPGEDVRVHVFASHFSPAFSSHHGLGVRAAPLRSRERHWNRTLTQSNRQLGDEVRYVFDRQSAPKFPGVMARRPTLLLNPWETEETETTEERLEKSEQVRGLRQPIVGNHSDPSGQFDGTVSATLSRNGGDDDSSLDFLTQPARLAANLRPDANGTVTLPIAALGSKHHLQVVAIRGDQTVSAHFVLPPQAQARRDLRMDAPTDPVQTFVQRSLTTRLAAGQPIEIANRSNARHTALITIGDAWNVLQTLSGNPTLRDFDWLKRWDTLPDAERRAKYSEFACHELHLFLHAKDRPFFNQVVRPYLANKRDKTFVDHYLLDNDLSDYLRPWAFSRLNTVEKILLGRRLGDRRESVARWMADKVTLQPPNPQADRQRFLAALGRNALQPQVVSGVTTVSTGGMLFGGGGDPFGGVTPPAFSAPRFDGGSDPFGGGGGGDPFGGSSDSFFGATPQEGEGIVSGFNSYGVDFPPPSEESAYFGPSDGENDLDLDDLLAAPAANKPKFSKEMEQASEKLRDQSRLVEDKAKQYNYRGAQELRRRGRSSSLYRESDTTREWAENNYYKRRIGEQTGFLIPLHAYWSDLAAHKGDGPFLSPEFTRATSSFTETLLALAFLDLPFTADAPQEKTEGDVLTLTPASPGILFHQELRDTRVDPARGPDNLLLAVDVFRNDNRSETVNGQTIERFVEPPLLPNVVYGTRVVLTNPRSTPRTVELLLQIPRGAMPVANGEASRGVTVELKGYASQSMETLFVFPTVPEGGEAIFYPVTVSENEVLLLDGGARRLPVVPETDDTDNASWFHIANIADDDAVLDALRNRNLNELDLGWIAWRMKDRGMYDQVLRVLRDRHAYNSTLWAYSLLHGDRDTLGEFLEAHPISSRLAPSFQSELITIDPVARHFTEHLEYAPLINPRIHAVGGERQIRNEDQKAQFERLLWTLAHRPAKPANPVVRAEDQLAVLYHLMLQDRFEDALERRAALPVDDLPEKLQLDYLDAYLALVQAQPERATALCVPHLEHPVDRWRERFTALHKQLAGADAATDPTKEFTAEDRNEEQAAQAPSLEFDVEGTTVTFRSRNLESAQLQLYPMDLELLFSRDPFATTGGNGSGQGQSGFRNVAPATRVAHNPDAPFTIPVAYQSRNLMFEAIAGGIRRSQPIFANRLNVAWVEPYGRLTVTHAGDADSAKPLPLTYVKVYARYSDGSVKFFRDGYTDFRGQFDYTANTTQALAGVQRLAVLVLHDEHGGLVRDVAPPKR